MAHNTTHINQAPVQPAAYIAPVAAESFPDPDDDQVYHVKVGATPTNATVVRPGTHQGGDAIDDLVIAIAANSEYFIPLRREYEDPTTRAAVINFSSVATVTGLLLVHARD